jgi:hypothetical protein
MNAFLRHDATAWEPIVGRLPPLSVVSPAGPILGARMHRASLTEPVAVK